MEIRDICSGTVIGSFQPDLRSGREKRRENGRRKDKRDGEKFKNTNKFILVVQTNQEDQQY